MFVSTRAFFRYVFFLSAICLLANDLLRVYYLVDARPFVSRSYDFPEQDNNEAGIFSLLEEEVKHHQPTPVISVVLFATIPLKCSVGHLIKDDTVKHLAFASIFSPPPDLA
jgi:hypothetical protein